MSDPGLHYSKTHWETGSNMVQSDFFNAIPIFSYSHFFMLTACHIADVKSLHKFSSMLNTVRHFAVHLKQENRSKILAKAVGNQSPHLPAFKSKCFFTTLAASV